MANTAQTPERPVAPDTPREEQVRMDEKALTKATVAVTRSSLADITAREYATRIVTAYLAALPPVPVAPEGAVAAIAPDVPWREALRTWRSFWHTPYSDALTLTGAQADALCDALAIPFDADEDAHPPPSKRRAEQQT